MRIDPEFKALIPQLTEDEFKYLEESILAEGCRDALVVWGDVLIDGHHRYEICTKHSIEYKTVQKEFETREEAKKWIIINQIGRRNVTPEQRKYLIGKLYLEEKKAQGGRSDRTFGDEIISPPKTAEHIGEQFGVTDRTVYNNAKFAKAVDIIADTYGEDVKQEILSGKTKIPAKEITNRAKQLFTSETPEWYTPKKIVDRVIEFFGEIDLDPCSNAHGDEANIPAKMHFTREDDGLRQEWKGKIYMNPPYGREVADWISKLHREVANNNVEEAIVLVASRTDTQWFNSLVREGYLWCAVEGRLSFTGLDTEKNCAPFPSAIFYIGERVQDFYHTFKDFGPICRVLFDEEMDQYE